MNYDLNELDSLLEEDFNLTEDFDLNSLDEDVELTDEEIYNQELARILQENKDESSFLNNEEIENLLLEQIPFSIPKDEENIEIMNDAKAPKNINWETTGSALAQKRSIKNQF